MAVLPHTVTFLKTSRVGQLNIAPLHPVTGHFQVLMGEMVNVMQSFDKVRCIVCRRLFSVLYLGQYPTNPYIAGVGVNSELHPWSWVAQDRCHAQGLFQCSESVLCFCGPLKYPFLFIQLSQRFSHIRKSGNELPVVRT
jgi:hypothetical protein